MSYKIITSSILLILFLYIPSRTLGTTFKTKIVLEKFNKLLDRIEYNINKDMLEEACINAKKAAFIISNNSEELKTAQPHYSWTDINELLEIIPAQLCQK